MKQYLKHDKSVNWVDFIKEYLPYNEQEQKDKEVILQCIDSFKDVLSRKNQIAHITSNISCPRQYNDNYITIF